MVSLGKDDCHVAFIGWENEDVGVGAERAKCRFSDLERLGCSERVGNIGSEILAKCG